MSLKLCENYYEVLDVSSDASQQDIEQAYRRAKSAYSGENLALYSLMGPEESEESLALIEEAFSIIGDPGKRKDYNQARGLQSAAQSAAPDGPAAQKSDRREVNEEIDFTTSPEVRASTFDRPDDFRLFKKDSSQVSKISANNRFSLNYESDPEFEKKIEAACDFPGEFLKQIREYKNVDIPRLSDMTRISKTHLKNIEDDNYQALPAPAYTRGFVFQYAKCLKLGPDLVANSYMEILRKNTNG